MTYEEKIAAIDRYFDNISSEEFNRILEEKYGIPMTVDIEEGLVSSNNVCDVMDRWYSLGQSCKTPLMGKDAQEYTENDLLYEDAA